MFPKKLQDTPLNGEKSSLLFKQASPSSQINKKEKRRIFTKLVRITQVLFFSLKVSFFIFHENKIFWILNADANYSRCGCQVASAVRRAMFCVSHRCRLAAAGHSIADDSEKLLCCFFRHSGGELDLQLASMSRFLINRRRQLDEKFSEKCFLNS